MEEWQRSELTEVTAKVVIFEAFVEGELEAPNHLARTVHDLYFEPKYDEFRRERFGVSPTPLRRPQGTGSDPPIQAAAKLGELLETKF